MTPYFASTERQKALRAAVHRWEGSSFHRTASKAGVAGSCVSMVANVLTQCGLPLDLLGPLPAWSTGHGIHHKDSQLLAWLMAVAARLRAEDSRYRLMPQDGGEPLMVGDLPVIKAARTPHHLGICDAPNRLAHICSVRGFVREPEEAHRKARTLHSSFRIVEKPMQTEEPTP